MGSVANERKARWSRIAATLLVLLVTAGIVAGVLAQWSQAATALPSGAFGNGALALAGGGGSAILGARGMVPGDSAVGNVVISNAGDAAGRFTLAAGALADRPGPGGGSLAQTLQLVVTDVTTSSAPRVVYRGTIAGLTGTDLGSFATGAVRVYRFSVTFPQAVAANYAFAGSSLSVRFDWTAVTTG